MNISYDERVTRTLHIKETQANPTRPMKARLAMGLSVLGGKVERALNKTMTEVVPVASLYTGTVGGCVGSLMGYQSKDAALTLGGLTAGTAAGLGAMSIAREQGSNPNSSFRKFTSGIRSACEKPLQVIEAKAQEQGRAWSLKPEDVGLPKLWRWTHKPWGSRANQLTAHELIYTAFGRYFCV